MENIHWIMNITNPLIYPLWDGESDKDMLKGKRQRFRMMITVMIITMMTTDH